MDGEDNNNTTSSPTPPTTTNSPRFPPHFYHHPNPFSASRNSFPPASALSPPAPTEPVKKKRGRPRKYGIGAASVSPLLGSSSSSSLKKNQSVLGSLPFSRSPGAGPGNSSLSEKKKKEAPGRGEAASSFSSPKKPLIGSLGQGFTPHVIIVNNGEDVAQRIVQFMQQTKRAICILSASGSISSASLRQPAAHGGQMTLEGRYEITSLSGSFLPTEHTGVSRTGGLSACLSGIEITSLVGGGVCGPLIASGPVTCQDGFHQSPSVVHETIMNQEQETKDMIDMELSTVKPGEAAPINQGSTLVTPVAFRPSIGSTERDSGSGVGDDESGTGVSDYFMQPNLISMNFMAHQWRGSLEGPSRTSHSTEEDIKSDGT